MYACGFETGCGFFEGVCMLKERPLNSQDPPPPIRELDPVRASHSKGERGKKKGREMIPDPLLSTGVKCLVAASAEATSAATAAS
jgi:hypothetical protein